MQEQLRPEVSSRAGGGLSTHSASTSPLVQPGSMQALMSASAVHATQETLTVTTGMVCVMMKMMVHDNAGRCRQFALLQHTVCHVSTLQVYQYISVWGNVQNMPAQYFHLFEAMQSLLRLHWLPTFPQQSSWTQATQENMTPDALTGTRLCGCIPAIAPLATASVICAGCRDVLADSGLFYALSCTDDSLATIHFCKSTSSAA